MTVFNAAVLRKGSVDLADALGRNAQKTQDALTAGARALSERHLKAVPSPEPVIGRSIAERLKDIEAEIARLLRQLADPKSGDFEGNYSKVKELRVDARNLMAQQRELLMPPKPLEQQSANFFVQPQKPSTVKTTNTNPFRDTNVVPTTKNDTTQPKTGIFDIANMSNDEIEATRQRLLDLNARMQANKRTTTPAVSAPVQAKAATTDIVPVTAAPAPAPALATASDVAPARKLPPPIPTSLKKGQSDDQMAPFMIRAKITHLQKQLENPNLKTEESTTLAAEIKKLEARLAPKRLGIVEEQERARKMLRASDENARKISEFKMMLGQRDSINVDPLTEKAKIETVRRYDNQFAALMAAPDYIHHTPNVSGPFQTLKQAKDNYRIKVANEAFMNVSRLDLARQAEHAMNQGYYDDFGRQLEIEGLINQPQTPEVQARIQQLKQESQAYNWYSDQDSLMRGKVTELADSDIIPIQDESKVITQALDEKPAHLNFDTPAGEIEIGNNYEVVEDLSQPQVAKVAEDAEEVIPDSEIEFFTEEPTAAITIPQPAPTQVPESLRLVSNNNEPKVPFDDQKTGRYWAGKYQQAKEQAKTGLHRILGIVKPKKSADAAEEIREAI